MKKTLLAAVATTVFAIGTSASGQTFTTADASVPIPDNSGTSITACQSIVIADSITIDNVQVQVTATHTWIGDLHFRLQGPTPSSTALTLLNRPGRNGSGAGESDDLSNSFPITFSDAATTSAEQMGVGCAGVIGVACPTTSYIPAPDPTDIPHNGVGSNLASFVGQDTSGIWTLCAADSAAADTGTLSSWSLIVTGVVTPPPAPTSIAPTSGPTTGGTAVTITGTDFQAGATATVGGAACAGPVVTVPNSIACTTPAGAAGAADVVVTNPDAQTGTLAGGFTYIAPIVPPAPTGVSPTSGPEAGGTPITITGTGFQAGATVTVGGAACNSVTVTVPNSISCSTPAGTPGAVDVVVTNPDAQIGTLTLGFTYVRGTTPPPVVQFVPGTGTLGLTFLALLLAGFGVLRVGRSRI